MNAHMTVDLHGSMHARPARLPLSVFQVTSAKVRRLIGVMGKETSMRTLVLTVKTAAGELVKKTVKVFGALAASPTPEAVKEAYWDLKILAFTVV
jgi:hypothetical protein